MLMSQFIEHCKQRVVEYGDHEVVFTDDSEVDVPDFNTDLDSPAFVMDSPL